MRLLVDTHVLLWWLTGPSRLSKDQVSALERAEQAGEAVAIAAISLWEIAKLVERGRLALHCSADAFFADLDDHAALAVLPLTSAIAVESTRLGAGFPSDPADQLIAATARVHGLRLVTADNRIRRTGVVSVV